MPCLTKLGYHVGSSWLGLALLELADWSLVASLVA
jgi:hypothetical protein